MDVVTLARIALRRWYVVLVVGALTAVGAHLLFQRSEPVYTGTAQIIVLPPTDVVTVKSGPRNPFADGGPKFAASVLAQSLTNPVIAGQLRAAGAAAPFTARVQKGEQIVLVTSTGPTSAAVSQTLKTVVQSSNTLLKGVQVKAGAPAGQLYVATQFTPVTVPVVSYPGRSKPVVGVVLGGILIALLLAVAIDSASRRRKHTRGSSVIIPLSDERFGQEGSYASESAQRGG